MFRILSNIGYYVDLLMRFENLSRLTHSDRENLIEIWYTLREICEKNNINIDKLAFKKE